MAMRDFKTISGLEESNSSFQSIGRKTSSIMMSRGLKCSSRSISNHVPSPEWVKAVSLLKSSVIPVVGCTDSNTERAFSSSPDIRYKPARESCACELPWAAAFSRQEMVFSGFPRLEKIIAALINAPASSVLSINASKHCSISRDSSSVLMPIRFCAWSNLSPRWSGYCVTALFMCFSRFPVRPSAVINSINQTWFSGWSGATSSADSACFTASFISPDRFKNSAFRRSNPCQEG